MNVDADLTVSESAVPCGCTVTQRKFSSEVLTRSSWTKARIVSSVPVDVVARYPGPVTTTCTLFSAGNVRESVRSDAIWMKSAWTTGEISMPFSEFGWYLTRASLTNGK